MISRLLVLTLLGTLLYSCIVKPTEYTKGHKYFDKISKKYEKVTNVEILYNEGCSPEYEITNVYPFVMNSTATCDCAKYNEVYQFYSETTGPNNFNHKIIPGSYMPVRVLSEGQFGAVSGTFKGTEILMKSKYGSKKKLPRGVYSTIESIELDNCKYSVKYTFYYDPDIRFPW